MSAQDWSLLAMAFVVVIFFFSLLWLANRQAEEEHERQARLKEFNRLRPARSRAEGVRLQPR